MIKRTAAEEKAHMEGVTAWHKDQRVTDNEYDLSDPLSKHWNDGFVIAIYYDQAFENRVGICET